MASRAGAAPGFNVNYTTRGTEVVSLVQTDFAGGSIAEVFIYLGSGDDKKLVSYEFNLF